MILKLKALALGLVALTALGALVAMDASAETGGHFTTDSMSKTTIITATQSGTHTVELAIPGLTGIVCETTTYEGKASGSTVEAITATPTHLGCKTTGGTAGELTIDMNGCQYRFTIGKNSAKDNTVDLVCPEGKQAVLTHPNCEIRIPAQTSLLGVAYTTTIENSKHSVTLDVTVKGFTAHFESGVCVLLGTKKEAAISGSVTVQGFEEVEGKEGSQVNITATGSEG